MAFCGKITGGRINDLECVRHIVWNLKDTSGNGVATDAFARCRSITVQVEGISASGIVSFSVSNDGQTFAAPPTAVSIFSDGLAAVPAGDGGRGGRVMEWAGGKRTLRPPT